MPGKQGAPYVWYDKMQQILCRAKARTRFDCEGIMVSLLILLILLILSGFFSASETALTTVNPVTLRSMACEGDARAARVLTVLESYPRLLSMILICNNVVNITASALFTAMLIRRFGAGVLTLGTALLTVLVLLFGEITPKNIAKIRCLELSLAAAPFLQFLMKVLTPVIVLVDLLADGVLRLFHIDRNARQKITTNELKTYVDTGQEDGILKSGEKKIIYNVFDFGDSVAKDIMIPRIDMTCVSSDATYDEILSLFRRDMFTRLPVYAGNDPDNIIGLINIKDFILIDDPASFRLKALLREAYFTYEYKKTADLLKDMQHGAQSVAFVLSEYGSTVGMVTLEDIVEEIVGEIRDEYDAEEKEQIRRYDTRTFLVEGSMKLDDINEALGSTFGSEDYDSIGGLMIEHLDRLPRGEEVVVLPDGTSLQAKGIRQNRIMKVLIRFREDPTIKKEDGPDDERQY